MRDPSVSLLDISSLTNLRELDLSGNRLNIIPDGVLATLGSNSTLLTLRLSDNNIGDEGAHQIARALATNTTLVELDLHNNGIGADGTNVLSSAHLRLTNLRLE